MKSRFAEAIVPLAAVIFIDSAAYTLIVPILAALLLENQSDMMAEHGQIARYVVYGVALGVFEFMMLYMAPVLGEISDRIGRRRVLVICMSGLALSFVFIGAGIALGAVWLLILGRIVGGGTAGSQAVAQAAAVDRSSTANKALVLNICLLASSLGFVAGPLIGGGLSHDNQSQISDFVIPVAVAAVMALVALLLVLRYVQQDAPLDAGSPGRSAPRQRIDLLMGVKGFKIAFADRPVRHLVLVFGFMQIAWGIYFLFLPSFLLGRFNEGPGTVSLLLSLLGVGFCLAYGVFVPLLGRFMSMRAIAIWGLWITAVLMAVSLLSYSMLMQWLVALPIAIAVSVAYGAIIVLFSDAVDSSKQGWILGITISVLAFTWGTSSVVSGVLSGFGYMLPFVLAMASLVVSAVLMMLPAPAPQTVPLVAGAAPEDAPDEVQKSPA